MSVIQYKVILFCQSPPIFHPQTQECIPIHSHNIYLMISFLHHNAFLAAMMVDVEPSRFSEAIPYLPWQDAMKSEIEALEKNGTWDLKILSHGKKALGYKWVYKINRKSDDTIKRYKTRLVILGNNKVEGLDYHETLALVAKMVTVYTLLTIVAYRNWPIHQMDVHNAFFTVIFLKKFI